MASSTILLVEDSPSLSRTYEAELNKAGFEVSVAASSAEALLKLNSGIDAILLDLMLPDGSGMDLLHKWQDRRDRPPVIVITADGSISTAIEAMKRGARDFLVKPFNGTRLVTTVRNIIETNTLRRRVETIDAIGTELSVHGMIGSSPIMNSVYAIIKNAAFSKATILITGETGTGKELAARAAHECGPRKDRPFVAINCAAIPKDLIESELFGHTKGAFTGANTDRQGAIAEAELGTLFLDEICEMDITLQAKLLRFLQLGTYRKVGGDLELQSNVRVVAATNRDPIREIKNGTFREDLYYRLQVIPVSLPPLRERGDDVIEIANEFLVQMAAEEGRGFAGFSRDASDLLKSHHWPGNVRELSNVLRQVIVLNAGELIDAPMLKTAIQSLRRPSQDEYDEEPVEQTPAVVVSLPHHIEPLWKTEKRAIESAIEVCDGNIQRASRLLEISASTIYRKKDAWSSIVQHRNTARVS